MVRSVRVSRYCTAFILTCFVVGCGGAAVELALSFPDAESRSSGRRLLVRAAEPFEADALGDDGRRFLSCRDLKLFGGFSDRAPNEGREQVADHALPLLDPWSIDLGGLAARSTSNPWRALIVHAQVLGPATSAEASTATEAALLEACRCIRFVDFVKDADPALREQIEAECTLAPASGALALRLDSVVPDAFELAPCSVDRGALAARGDAHIRPGFCLRPRVCSKDDEGSCYQCINPDCSELDDLSGFPVGLSSSSSLVSIRHETVLTDKQGRVEIPVHAAHCTAPFSISASVVGSGAVAELTVDCVPPIRFASTEQSNFRGPVDAKLVAATVLEGPLVGEAKRAASRVVLLWNSRGDTVLELHRFEQGTFTREYRRLFENEEALAVLGYYYDVGRGPARHDRPMLALATSTGGTPRLRIFSWDASQLLFARQTSAACPVCACAKPSLDTALSCQMCDCTQRVGASGRLLLEAADLDQDGYSDLSLASPEGTVVTTYYSAHRDGRPVDRQQLPPELDANCTCRSVGRFVRTLSMPKLGGTASGETQNHDVVVGGVTGAHVRYASGAVHEGVRCEPGDDLGCPTGQVCEPFCGEAGARCLQPCGPEAACLSQAAPTCASFPDERGVEYCAGPELGCGPGAPFGDVVNVHDLSRATLTRSGFEDLVMIGFDSVAPDLEDPGRVRVFFGDRHDLAEVNTREPRAQRRSTLELSFDPRKRVPLGPRSARAADFNGDGQDDLAVLYGASDQVRIWLSAGHRAPAALSEPIDLSACEGGCVPTSCGPFGSFAASDFDGDGRPEVVAVCLNDASASLRRYVPRALP